MDTNKFIIPMYPDGQAPEVSGSDNPEKYTFYDEGYRQWTVFDVGYYFSELTYLGKNPSM